MTPPPPLRVDAGTTDACAHAVRAEFAAYQRAFRDASRAAARHFERCDWAAGHANAAARLALYAAHVERAIAAVTACAGARSAERDLWAGMRSAYATLVDGVADQEIAETFFNSVTRRHFGTVGVDQPIEFLEPWRPLPPASPDDADSRWCAGGRGDVPLAAAVLATVPHPLANGKADAERVGEAVRAAVADAWGASEVDGAEMLATLFYRNKGAYLVGRLRRGGQSLPLVVALLNTPTGVVADAVLTSSDEVSVVFGFAWSYFHADIARPSATVAFLSAIMPQKRVDELYTAIGYNKHGKTELYRALTYHLAQPSARFEEAEGTKGLVMTVFTLPSLNIVLKIIKDRIGAPKRTTRRHVMAQYHRVFVHDRVGRLADAQLFQGLEFRRECFSEVLLAELLDVAPSAVRVAGDLVTLGHLYTERRLRPLNLYLQEVDDAAADAAILDYGNAIKDLAAANIFPGDLLLKNFGVSRHGRVIFYDYDELALLTECSFRHIPQATSDDDELSAEPWFSVGEHDIFPEEFVPFLLPPGRLRDVFLDAHGDLLDPAWWRGVQERQRAGELVDTFPYPRARRLDVSGARRS
jgi:isocitrate dehydrogenase kinase/phosphatase